jgi:1-deoxy-D-xylulose-5-phosphate reductoisomerase
MRKVIIFGSTGSVGRNALAVIKQAPDKFKVVGLCANSDITTLLSQIKRFSPAYVCVVNKKSAQRIKRHLSKKVKLLKGEEGLKEFCRIKSDISVMAISGISCLKPLLWNLRHTKRVALANKESIVTAGSFIFAEAKKQNVDILPVDSEINSFYQLFQMDMQCLDKVYLTASGGALIDYKKADIKKVGVREVLSHPTWSMGQRITVDSATLVNKGFEVIETHYFFNLPYNNINIVIHRQSMVHAMVEFKDGSLFACLYPPDMKVPISFALYYPQRGPKVKRINFLKEFTLSFSPIDYRRFPLLEIILQAARREDNSLAILNACDEVAVDYFLKQKIKFVHIYDIMKFIFHHYPSCKLEKIEDVFFWDNWARIKTKEYIEKSSIRG